MKNLYLAVFAILMCCATGYSQNDEYLKLENKRILKARKVEKDIENFISQNVKNYALKPETETAIREALLEESEHHGEKITEKEIQEAISSAKAYELRMLYFKNNPDKASVMKATPRITKDGTTKAAKNSAVALTVPADCFNGDFEQGLAGYTFRRNRPQDLSTPTTNPNDTGFDILNCEISTDSLTDLAPGFTGFIPPTNIFNSEGGTLVTVQGVDATLAPFAPFPSGVNVNMIHGGNASMKLNRSAGGTDITAMTRTVHPSTNDIGFHFSLIVQNPHPPGPGVPDARDQPFFTVRVYRGNEIVSTNNICITADTNNNIFNIIDPDNNPATPNGILYTGWVCDRIKIPDNLVDTDLTMEFIITDCGQTAHFGTVYIDDICDACERPTFGSIEMDDAGFNCPTDTIDICGTINMPVDNNGNPNTVELRVENSDGSIVHTYNNVLITNPTGSLFERRFCFTIDPSLYTHEDYTFVVIADFGTHTVSDFGATGNVDLSFNSNGTVLNSYVVRNELYWDGTEESYDLEFMVDSVCCPDNEVIDPIPAYYATTVTENHINIYNVTNHIQFECFRWRIKTSCGWSEWCCITTSQGNDFPPQAYWGNVYEPACYDATIDLCESFLEEGNPVVANGSQYEQREDYIKAFNTINNNARVTYQAGNYVLLSRYFSAAKTSVFTARIEECIPQTVFTTVANTSRTGEPNIVSVTQSEQPDNGFKVYPNPTDEIVYVASQTQVQIYIVTDITGKEVMRVNAEKDQTSVNLSNLESGIYMLMADGKLIQKIIKQ